MFSISRCPEAVELFLRTEIESLAFMLDRRTLFDLEVKKLPSFRDSVNDDELSTIEIASRYARIVDLLEIFEMGAYLDERKFDQMKVGLTGHSHDGLSRQQVVNSFGEPTWELRLGEFGCLCYGCEQRNYDWIYLDMTFKFNEMLILRTRVGQE